MMGDQHQAGRAVSRLMARFYLVGLLAAAALVFLLF